MSDTLNNVPNSLIQNEEKHELSISPSTETISVSSSSTTETIGSISSLQDQHSIDVQSSSNIEETIPSIESLIDSFEPIEEKKDILLNQEPVIVDESFKNMTQIERLNEIEKILNNIVIESTDSDECCVIKNTDSIEQEVKLENDESVKLENIDSSSQSDQSDKEDQNDKDQLPIINKDEINSSGVDETKQEVKTEEKDEMTRIENLEKMVKNLDSVTQQLLKENNELKSFKEYHETSYIQYLYSKLTGLWY